MLWLLDLVSVAEDYLVIAVGKRVGRNEVGGLSYSNEIVLASGGLAKL